MRYFLIIISTFVLGSSMALARGVPASVPFVGCPSEGQLGPIDAVNYANRLAIMPADVISRLAVYKGHEGIGVLGPKGWFCYELYGSNGNQLLITPKPLNVPLTANITGFGIHYYVISSETSGRFEVARMIARVFPKRMKFARQVIDEGMFPVSDFPIGPFPGDRLTYRGDSVVEFETPANTDGLGTMSRMKRANLQISGVAMVYPDPWPDIAYLAVRLPPEFQNLRPWIKSEFVRLSRK
jgi:hypothetical protein